MFYTVSMIMGEFSATRTKVGRWSDRSPEVGFASSGFLIAGLPLNRRQTDPRKDVLRIAVWLRLATSIGKLDNIDSGQIAPVRRIALPRLDVNAEEIMSPIAHSPMLSSPLAAA